MNELKERILRDLEVLKRDEGLKAFSLKYSEWRKNHIQDYEKTLRSLKYIFKSQGLALPKDYSELFFDWIWNAPLDSKVREIMSQPIRDEGIFDLEKIPKEYFIQWAKEETQRLITKEEVEKPLNHSQKTRVDYEPKYRFYLLEKLGAIDPKGIFYSTKLTLNQRAELLSKVLGYNSRGCKDLLNGQIKYDEEKKERIDDYLSNLMKNSTH